VPITIPPRIEDRGAGDVPRLKMPPSPVKGDVDEIGYQVVANQAAAGLSLLSSPIQSKSPKDSPRPRFSSSKKNYNKCHHYRVII
jgi:hypothetical protein